MSQATSNTCVSVSTKDWTESRRLWRSMFQNVESSSTINGETLLSQMKRLETLLFDKYGNDSSIVDYNIDDETFDKIMNEVDGVTVISNSNDEAKTTDENAAPSNDKDKDGKEEKDKVKDKENAVAAQSDKDLKELIKKPVKCLLW